MMKSRQKVFLTNMMISVLACLFMFEAAAQTSAIDRLVVRGDSLRAAYRFDESLDLYSEAVESLGDSLLSDADSVLALMLKDRILLSENGKSMVSYVYSPTVVARHMFSVGDFFLYYPLKDRSWRATPNQLDSFPGIYSKAIYAPAEDRSIYFSGTDKGGVRNIYRTEKTDTAWTRPSLLNEAVTSASNEIYPMISPDGKSMFFASDGLYGVGGYDLYVSAWDDAAGDWSTPVNMGFPYSSPANDYLLINTADGKYTIFASDRGCPKDSVWVYVLEYDNVPVRSQIDDPEMLERLSRLEPSSKKGIDMRDLSVKSEIPKNAETRRYMDKMSQVRELRDSISQCEERLAGYREKYSIIGNEAEKKKLADMILKEESMIPDFRKRLDEAVGQLQKIEMDFLLNGVIIDPGRLLEEAEREIVSDVPGYVFSKMDMGEPLTLEMERPKQEFDYSFKILERGQFALSNEIPQGVIYQIQMFASGRKAQVKDLKGLSPVFESMSSTGKHVYRVGLFNTYKDVLSNLNAVKRCGFKSAFIVGYIDGKEVSVSDARKAEEDRSRVSSELYNVIIVPSGEDMDSISVEGIRQQAGGKDVARSADGFIVGPFEDKAQAQALVEFVNVMKYGKAFLEKSEKQ